MVKVYRDEDAKLETVKDVSVTVMIDKIDAHRIENVDRQIRTISGLE